MRQLHSARQLGSALLPPQPPGQAQARLIGHEHWPLRYRHVHLLGQCTTAAPALAAAGTTAAAAAAVTLVAA